MSVTQIIQPLPGRWQDRIRTGIFGPAFYGYGVIVVFLVGFGYWAMTAQLSGAAVASGVVAAVGQNVMVQHLDGGIVSEIRVHEGDQVKAGQPLLELDRTEQQTLRNRLGNKVSELRLEAAVLRAERDGSETLDLAAERVPGLDDDSFAGMAEEHMKEFTARLSRFKAEQEILGKRVAALEDGVTGLNAQKKASEDQLVLVREEIDRKKLLLDKGLTNRSEYSVLLRTEAELIGQSGSLQSQIASSVNQRAEAREQIERLKTQRVEDAVTSLNKVRADLRDAEEQLIAADAKLSRSQIRSPVAGVIVRSMFNAKGSVIRASEPVVEILPTGDALIIEVRVTPSDIDAIQPGQRASLQFTALNARKTPRVDGTVTYVAADRQMDQKTGQPFYIVRVRIGDTLPPDLKRSQIYPGMPVETYFITGERTFAEYLVRPILDSFARAFREE